MRNLHLLLAALLSISLACGSNESSSSTENNTGSTNNSTGNNFDPDTPGVVSFSPADAAIDVARDVVATVVFSEAMDPETVNFDTVFIEATDGKVQAEISIDGAEVSIQPDELLDPLTEYDIVVTREVADPDGNTPASVRRASFTTAEAEELEEMGVEGTNPENGARDVRVDTEISITYTSNVDPETVDEDSFRVVDSFDNPVEGEFLVDELNIFFRPGENLEPMQTYTVTVTDDVRSNQNETGAFTWSFTTIPSIEFVASAPADESDDADIDTSLILTLSSETELESSTNDTIVIHAETHLADQRVSRERVMANFSVSGNTIIVEPEDGRWREFGTVYHVEIDGVLSSAGAPLPPRELRFATTLFDSNYLYTFTNEGEPRSMAVDGSTGGYADSAVTLPDAADPSARWGLDREDDGSYQISSPQNAGESLSGETLVDMGDPTSVVRLATTDASSAAQKWEFEPVAESGESAPQSPLTYRVKTQAHAGHSLGILDLSGTYRVYLTPDETLDTQLWRFENVGPR